MIAHYKETLGDEAATLAFGQRLARATFQQSADHYPKPQGQSGYPCVGGVIHLHGDLGAGKTTLTRGIMRGYGFDGAVKSPTYTLVEPYDFENCRIYHFDLYRLADPEEVEYLGTDEYFAANNLCIVEWAEKGKQHIPHADLSIHLSGTGTARDLQCRTHTGKGEIIAKRLWETGRSL